MSSLKATQADGYYLPPAYFDSGSYKKKSVSQFAGSKGHNQYLTKSIVRFELPYDGFCLGCQSVASKGTRYNAHKSHVDNYLSSKIYQFSLQCYTCKQEFKIQNNPQKQCFDYIDGIKRKTEEFDTVAAQSHGVIDTEYGNGFMPSIALSDDTKKANNLQDPLSKLETLIVGERKALSDRDSLEILLKHNNITMFNDSACNAELRSTFRADKNARKRRLEAASSLGLGEGFELQDTTAEDVYEAKAVIDERRRQKMKSSAEREKQIFRKIHGESIFSTKSKRKRNK